MLEFRREAVELLKRSGKSVPVLASELGVSPQSLRSWARRIDIDEAAARARAARSARSCAGCAPRSQDAHRGARDFETSAAFFARDSETRR
jgi:transposase-like protein